MLTRRNFLAATAALATQAASAKPLNVIMIYADDMGFGDLGCYGSKLNTPNLDRMAREGVRFTHFNSANPVCSPSRAALLTGRYPTRVGVPRVLFPVDKTGLPAGEITLADMFKTKNYRTLCVGKWHLGHLPEHLPMKHGFDHYFGIPYSNDMNPRWLMRDEKVLEEQATLETLTPRYTEEAVKFIEESKGGPFFLYMPHTYPHIPLAASDRFRGTTAHGIYGDVISEIDWSAGEIFKTLRRLKLDRDTLVMFSSDNGPWYQGSSGGLRGRKGMTWEGGVREPFIAWLPGRIPAGKVSHGWSSTMDLVPTVAKLCGLELKNPTDGIDIWPLLTGQKAQLEREAVLYFDGLYCQCARLGKWKLHIARYNTVTYSPNPAAGRFNLRINPELYDLEADPDESFDVADKHPDIVADIERRTEKLIEGLPEDVRKAHEDTKNRKSVRPPAGSLPRPA